MPNRLLKESICTSDDIDSLSDQEEAFFYRLMVNCDDFGLFDARPSVVKSRCYPLKSIDCSIIQSMLNKLAQSGLIRLYSVEGKPFLMLIGWSKHQQIRAKRPKYPLPETSNDEHLISDDINGNQLQSNVPVIQSNPIQSNPNPIQSIPAEESAVEPVVASIPKPVKRATPIPDAFAPNANGVEYAAGKRLALEPEIDQFKNWHTAKGSTFKDWQAAWRTWCDKAVEFGRSGQSNARASPIKTPAPDNFNSKDYGTRAMI